ncbi:ABC transporter permease [Alkalibacter mobilis]|uniref:ABC transporter permease n=1 Tax=Alkalibacter mobilis TaxID=2787712 RepID=UPI00189D4C15|nr:ABC transporter permease [Alkalibacter mobilis]MBF7096734.1 ABC transporter permease [Alkalibacter mobilis]
MKILNKVTWKNLQKNRTRTLVTIVGIILSVSLFTAITTSVFSLQSYLIEVVKEQEGDFYGGALNITAADIQTLRDEEEIEAVSTLEHIGYALLEGIQNEDKPYLFVGAMDEEFSLMMPVHLVDGILPEDSSQILLPEHLSSNGGVTMSLGDEITLDVGKRVHDGIIMTQSQSFLKGAEALEGEETKTYTVVGFYERPSFEGFTAPGYTALTVADGTGNGSFDVYLRVKPMEGIYTFLDETGFEETVVNSNLLRFSGNSNENTLNDVLYSMVAVLSAIIMFGSISLIYNAFSISISERTKQFGLLKSIGATKKQVMGSVIFEAFILSAVGIPLGILLGITGIGLTFTFAKDIFKALWNSGTNAQLILRISPTALLLAAALGLVTVLISAAIPARKAAKISAMDAIRQTNDIKIKAGKVKTSRITYKLFGFNGMLAAKNFKRNKRKYRATVISLFMSVVLFISASSFTSYLQKSTSQLFGEATYDISYTLTPEQQIDAGHLRELLTSVEGIRDSSYEYSEMGAGILVPKDLVEENYQKLAGTNWMQEIVGMTEGEMLLDMHLIFLDDDSFMRLLENNRLDAGEYMGRDEPKALVYTKGKIFDPEDSKYYTYDALEEGYFTAKGVEIMDVEGAYFTGEARGDQLVYRDLNEVEVLLPKKDGITTRELELGYIIPELPMMATNLMGTDIKVIYPFSASKEILGEKEDIPINLYFHVDDHKAAYEEMTRLLKEEKLSYSRLIDHGAFQEQDRAMISVINIFSYGFIILISLIAAANVFNTISTNIHLRRREFAMLKTVGMTQKGFWNMMTYESTLYGLKGIIYGIPVAVGITYLIYISISNGMEFPFYMPVKPVVIAIGSVFLVVFASSIYAMDKIRKDNPMDALKSENI